MIDRTIFSRCPVNGQTADHRFVVGSIGIYFFIYFLPSP